VPLWLVKFRLRATNPAHRRSAAQKLCAKPVPQAIPLLTEALKDQDAEVRRLAVTALGMLDDDARIAPLLSALQDRDTEVQKAAITGTKRLTGAQSSAALVSILRTGDAAVKAHAARMLQWLGWQPSNREEEICFWAARGNFTRVADMGPDAIGPLESILATGSYSVSVGAIRALGAIGDPRACKSLINALSARDTAVVVAAVDALSKIGGAEASRATVKMLRHDSPQVRLVAVEGVWELRAESGIVPLRGLLKDKAWDVRRAAAEVLGKLRDVQSIQGLSLLLGDPDADVRESAATALGRLMDRRAIGPLVMAFKDPASGVRRFAAAALGRIDHEWSTSNEGREALEALKNSLGESDSDIRQFIGHLLRGVGVAASTKRKTSASPDPYATQDRQQKLAISILLNILEDQDRDLRQASAEALGKIADPRTETALVRAMSDPDESVREVVDIALKALRSQRPDLMEL
jgi:HEAT repeat protein